MSWARRAAVTARRVLWMNPVRPPPVVHKPARAPEGQEGEPTGPDGMTEAELEAEAGTTL